MAGPAPRWTRLEHDERREQILAAARKLFAAEHYGAVSTSAIAREAGVARGLLHHYFGTKRELYIAVVRSALELGPPMDPQWIEGKDPEEVVQTMVGHWLDGLHRNRDVWVAMGALGNDPDVAEALADANELAVERLVDLARALGSDAPDTVLRGAITAWGHQAEALAREWLERERLSRDQAHSLIASSLLHLVRDGLPRATDPRPRRAP